MTGPESALIDGITGPLLQLIGEIAYRLIAMLLWLLNLGLFELIRILLLLFIEAIN